MINIESIKEYVLWHNKNNSLNNENINRAWAEGFVSGVHVGSDKITDKIFDELIAWIRKEVLTDKITWDYRYENTLRLNFTHKVKDTSLVSEIVCQVLGEDIELDWRDDQELEIHNVVNKGLEDLLIYRLDKNINVS